MLTISIRPNSAILYSGKEVGGLIVRCENQVRGVKLYCNTPVYIIIVHTIQESSDVLATLFHAIGMELAEV